MAFCTNCGAELKKDAVFCTKCGARVAPETEPPAPETPEPETPVPETPAPETPEAGSGEPETPEPEAPEAEAPIPESQAPTAGEPAPAVPAAGKKAGASRRTLIIAAIALAVVVIGVAVAVVLMVQKAKSDVRADQTALWLDYGEQTGQWLEDMDDRQERLILTAAEETELDSARERIEADLALELDWDSADTPEEAEAAAQAAIEVQKQDLERRMEDIGRANQGQVSTLRTQLEGEDLSWAVDSDLTQVETLRREVEGKVADGDYRAAWEALGQWQDVALRASTPPQGFTVSVSQYDLSAYPTVRAYLDVTDAGGSFVSGLDQGAFYVNERKNVDGPFTRRTVTRAAQINEESGISIGLIADVSGSMYDSIDQAKAVMRSFMGTVQFDKGDEVELLEFADTSYICNAFTNSYSDIVSSINAMSANGGTRLYDTLVSEIERIPTRSNAKCIIGFTDGYDNRSVHTAQDVIDAANAYRVPVFLIGVGGGCDEASLRRVSEGTGGFYRSISDIGGLESIYNAIYRQAKELYLVEFQVEDADNFDELCYLDFQVRSEDGRGGYVSGYAVEPGDFFDLMYNKFLVACMDCQTKGERNLLESGVITTNSESYSNKNCLAYQSEATIRTNGPGSNDSGIFEVLTGYDVLEVHKDGDGYILYGLCEFDVSQTKAYSRCREKEKEVIAAQYGEVDQNATFWIEESIYNYEKLTLIRDTDGKWKFHTRVYERPSGSGSAYGINEVYKIYMQ